MAEKKEVTKNIEREYVIPLRNKCMTVVRYKKAPKAVKVVKEFIAKHMKVEDRDLTNS
jgi:ribosomal protein L31E